MSDLISDLKRQCVLVGLLAAGCVEVAHPTATSVPTPVETALPTVSVPFPVLSSSNILSVTKLGTLQPGPGARAACALQRDVLAVGDSKALTVYNVSTLAQVLSIQTNKAYPLLAVSPDGQRIADVDAGGEVLIWDTATGRSVRHMKLYTVVGTVFQEVGMYTVDLTFGPHHWIVVGAASKAFVLTADTGQVNRIFGGAQSTGSYTAISADGQMAALANVVKGTISIWKTADGQLTQQLTAPAGDWLTGLAFSRDGTRVAAGDKTRGIYFWDTRTGQLVSTLAQAGLQTFALSSDGTLLFGARSNQVGAWEINTGKLLRTFDVTSSPTQVLETCLDGRFLLAGSQAGDVDVWGVKS